jgi:hypothetical protein
MSLRTHVRLEADALHRMVAGRGDGPAAGRRPLREAVCLWVGSRVALGLLVLAGSWLAGVDGQLRAAHPGQWVLDRFTWWDSLHFTRIAEQGYLPPGLPCCDQAFFPGYPLLIRMVTPLTAGSAPLAGLVVANLAGVVAALMLWRLASDTGGGPRVGSAAVLLLALAPYGIFLSVVYSESLFLALAVGAWWAGTQRRWWLAGALAGAAAGVRINGLFLALALGVMYAVQLHAEGRLRPRRDTAALLLPFAVTGAYFGYLFARTGSADAWQQAQAGGWSRATAWPWDGLAAGWRAIAGATSPDLVVARWADLLAVVAGLVLVVALAWLRRWPELVYVGLSVAVLVCSTMLTSAPRYALTWFPAYLLLAQLVVRPRWRWPTIALAAVCLPLLAVLSLAFAAHQWVS